MFPPTAHTPNNVRLPNLYGPQVSLLFVPLARLSFLTAAQIWVALSLLIYFVCIYAVWKSCPHLRPYSKIVTIAAIAFPPLFHFFMRGQISALVLLCFTAAFLALQADRLWLAGLALGFLVFKPQFLVAIPLILLLARSWKIFLALVISAGGQLAFARIYFGPDIMRAYFDMLLHTARWIDTAELPLASIQMHSLRSFWSLLVPSPTVALALYLLTSIFVVAITASFWKSSSPLALRFAALTFAAVLVNPHLFVYDLLVLAPALLLVTDWMLANPRPASSPLLRVLLYLVFILPLFGPLSYFTHLQLSVVVFVATLWTLHRSVTRGHKLASDESRVV